MFSTQHSKAKLERNPTEKKHRFILTIDDVNVFQWFREKAKNYLSNSVSSPLRKGPKS